MEAGYGAMELENPEPDAASGSTVGAWVTPSAVRMVERTEATAGFAKETGANPTDNPTETQAMDQMENLNASEQEAPAISTEQFADNWRISESEAEFESKSEAEFESESVAEFESEFESESESKSESLQEKSVSVNIRYKREWMKFA